MRNLKHVMIELQDFLCVSHTLSKLGEHIELSTLFEFMTHWLGLVQHHPSAKRLWKEETGGEAMQGYSTIRWCSREVVQNELAVKLGTHVSDFVDKLLERDIGDAHPKKMRQILDSKFDTLQLELALSLDLERIINAVHRMEGDGLVILLAYGEIDALLTFGDSIGDNPYTMPNVAKLLRDKIKLDKHTKIYEYFEGLGCGLRAKSPPLLPVSIALYTPTERALLNRSRRFATGLMYATTLSGNASLPRLRKAFRTSK
eukprot:4569574-Prymnesium_polylepis.1